MAPFWPSSIIPRSLPLTRFRHVTWQVVAASRCYGASLLVRRLDILATALWIILFIVSSSPSYRERAPGVYETGSVAAASETVKTCCFCLFFAQFLLKLLTVTAVPNVKETALLSVAASPRFDALVDESKPLFARKSPPAPVAEDSDDTDDEGGTRLRGLGDDHAVWGRVEAWAAHAAPVSPLSSVPSATAFAFERDAACSLSILIRGGARVLSFLTKPAVFFLDIVFFLSWAAESIPNVPEGVIALRFLRLFRLLRGVEDTAAFRVLRRSAMSTAKALATTFLPVAALCIVIFSAALYVCERGTWDPARGTWVRESTSPITGETRQEESPFKSVAHASWWAIVTLSGVGYGDMVPTSLDGKLATSAAIAAGVLLVATPSALLGFNFSREWERVELRERARAKRTRRLARDPTFASREARSRAETELVIADAVAKIFAEKERGVTASVK